MTSRDGKVIGNRTHLPRPKVFPFGVDRAGRDLAGGRVCQCSGLIPDRASKTLSYLCLGEFIRANLPSFEVTTWRQSSTHPMASFIHGTITTWKFVFH